MEVHVLIYQQLHHSDVTVQRDGVVQHVPSVCIYKARGYRTIGVLIIVYTGLRNICHERVMLSVYHEGRYPDVMDTKMICECHASMEK